MSISENKPCYLIVILSIVTIDLTWWVPVCLPSVVSYVTYYVSWITCFDIYSYFMFIIHTLNVLWTQNLGRWVGLVFNCKLVNAFIVYGYLSKLVSRNNLEYSYVYNLSVNNTYPRVAARFKPYISEITNLMYVRSGLSI